MTKTHETELKACPFCGKEAVLKIEGDHHGEFFSLGCVVSFEGLSSSCPGANAFYTAPIEEKEVAILSWNQRPQEPAHSKGVEPCIIRKVQNVISEVLGTHITSGNIDMISVNLEDVIVQINDKLKLVLTHSKDKAVDGDNEK